MTKLVEIVAKNHFNGLSGKIVSEMGDKVEVLVELDGGNEFKYLGNVKDVKVLEKV